MLEGDIWRLYVLLFNVFLKVDRFVILRFSLCIMKPAVWYMMMVIVGFLYIYVALVQYIRGQETPPNKDIFMPTYDPKYYDEELGRSVKEKDLTLLIKNSSCN